MKEQDKPHKRLFSPAELNDSPRHESMKARLLQEAKEYLDTKDEREALAKLADIHATIHSLTEFHGASTIELELMHQKKRGKDPS